MTMTMIHGTQPLYRGAVYTVSQSEAQELIQAGMAVPVSDKSAATAEKAVSEIQVEERKPSPPNRSRSKK